MNKTTKKSTTPKKSTSSKGGQKKLVATVGYFPKDIDEKYFGKGAKKK